MNHISHSNPARGYTANREGIDAAVRGVLESGRYILGGEVAAFEVEFARYLGASACIGVGNGTDAIELVLRSLGIGSGDAVITAANTAVATVAAIELSGAQAIVCDVETETMTLSAREVERVMASAAGSRACAIIPVHLYGQPAPMTALKKLAEKHGLKVIEDCAQAHGAEIDGRKVGTFGDAAAFSFYPTKNLAGFGDGGALVMNDPTIAARARELRVYGWRERYISEMPGMNTRLDEMQAAILRVRLRGLDRENERRREIAAIYDARLSGLELLLPSTAPGTMHVYHQYVVRTPRRDRLREFLQRADIETAVLYPVPIHEQPAYRNRGLTDAPLPVAEKGSRELLCLPMNPWLRDDEAERVCAVICDWLGTTS